MVRILTGIQSTGTPHLGNLLGNYSYHLNYLNKKIVKVYFLWPDLHSFTTIRNPEIFKK